MALNPLLTGSANPRLEDLDVRLGILGELATPKAGRQG